MHVEVSVALNFVISYLYNKLPRRRVNMFGEELERGLKKKFEGHWYPDKPFKGSAFRCVRVSGEKTEPVITMAAHLSGLDIIEVKGYLPTDLTIWIDPSEVSYRIGEKGMVKILYSDKRIGDEDLIDSMDREVQNASRGFNPEAQSFKPIDSLSSSLSNLSLSPSPNGWGSTSPTQPQLPPQGQTNNAKNSSTSPINSFLNRSNNNQVFTAATFAQTKFGSTKLKSHSKRPNRLSPTELQAASFSKHQQRQLFQTPWNNRVMIPQLQQHQQGPLSPRHPRQDYMEQQQQRLLLWQQQQQQQLQSSGLLSPIGGSLGDLQLPSQQPSSLMYGQNDLLSPGSRGTSGSNVTPQGTPSPDNPNKEFLDGLNWSAASPYASLQHLLVAN